MTIAFVTGYLSALSGGVSQAVLPLVRALRRRGVAVELFGLRDPKQPSTDLPRSVGSESKTLGPWSFGFSPSLLRSIKRGRPELAHAHGIWAFPSLAAYVASRHLGVPHIVSPHGMLDPWTFRRSTWRRNVAAAIFEYANLRDANCIHALNGAEMEAIRAYGLKNPVAVVANGVDLPTEALHVPSESRKILFLGRIDPKKGVAELLRAWALAMARSELGGWQLEVTGWGHPGYGDSMVSLARQLGIEGNVTFTGPRFDDDKARAFREAAGFILPSHSEGLPMAVLEAWSYCLPVLMTRACNLPEGFAAGAAVEITTAPEQMAEALGGFLAMTDAERRVMGAAGRRLVEQRFTWDRVAAEMHEVYTWVLGGGPPPSCVVTD